MELLIWINTLIVLAAVIVEVVVVVAGLRKLSADNREIVSMARQNSEMFSRIERISLATLERVAPSGQQA